MKKAFIGLCVAALTVMVCGSAMAAHDPVATCPTAGIPIQFGYCELPTFEQGTGKDPDALVTAWPTVYDFCGMLDEAACSVNGVGALGIDLGDAAALVPVLQCINADINGPVDTAAAIPVTPNGVPDGQFELGVIAEALNNASNPYHAEVLSKFQYNFQNIKNLVAEALVAAGYWNYAGVLPTLIGSLGGAIAGYAELGDAQTIAALNALVDLLGGIGVTPPVGGITAITQSVPALSMDGTADADGDGFSNLAEYNYYKSQGPAVTIAAIYNAQQTPPATVPRVLVLGGGTFQVGSKLSLSAVVLNCSAADYQWYKNGAAIDSATGSALEIPVLADTDSGKYKCQIHTTAKAAGDLIVSPEVTVNVVAVLPIAGGLGLALLAGACALGGVSSIRRRK